MGKIASEIFILLTDYDSHLINNGVAESPPSRSLVNGNSSAPTGPIPHDLFIDLEGTNVGFKHWHPISVVEKGNQLCGQADMGGVWEWTSTVLEKHEGFEPMKLYPGYTGMLLVPTISVIWTIY